MKEKAKCESDEGFRTNIYNNGKKIMSAVHIIGYGTLKSQLLPVVVIANARDSNDVNLLIQGDVKEVYRIDSTESDVRYTNHRDPLHLYNSNWDQQHHAACEARLNRNKNTKTFSARSRTQCSSRIHFWTKASPKELQQSAPGRHASSGFPRPLPDCRST